MPDDWGGYNVPSSPASTVASRSTANNVYFLSNDAKLHSIDHEDRQGQLGQAFDGFPYPKDFAKAPDASGYAITVGPMAIPGIIIVPMNAHRLRRLARLRAGREPARTARGSGRRNMIPGPGEIGATTPGRRGATQYGGAGPWIIGSGIPS